MRNNTLEQNHSPVDHMITLLHEVHGGGKTFKISIYMFLSKQSIYIYQRIETFALEDTDVEVGQVCN